MTEYITVVGNIANAPERATLHNGDTVVRFRVAAATQRRQDDGTWVDTHTSWYKVSAFRRLGEHALASLEKGQRVIVTGRFRVRDWDSNGKHGTDAEIDADALGPDLRFGISRFRKEERQGAATGVRHSEAEQPAPTEWAEDESEQRGSGDPHSAETQEPFQSPPSVPEPALVGATSWDTRPLGDPTPF